MQHPITQKLAELARRDKRLEQGQTLFGQGDPVEMLYVVREGAVTLCRIGKDGEPAILQRARAGDILAEASAFSKTYHCAAVAEAPTRLACVPVAALHRALASDPALALELLEHMGRELRRARMRAEILSLKTVRARLAAWREWQGGALPPRGKWSHLADELGVSPEALYREMARRRLEESKG